MQRRSGKGGSNPRLQIMPATPQPLVEPEIPRIRHQYLQKTEDFVQYILPPTFSHIMEQLSETEKTATISR
jgi:hypothetical protein